MGGHSILIGASSEAQVHMAARYANRHGLIAGATGTGKTVTLQVLAEAFSQLGVPSLITDVKGDLSGLAQPIAPHPKIDERIAAIGIEEFQPTGHPVTIWDAFGEHGHPMRTTISELGPLLLARLLELNETQEGVLNIAFRVADEEGLLLLDLKDLRAMLAFVAEQRKALSITYGNVSSASVAAIQRRLLVLEDQGGAHLFGEPALHISDLMQTRAGQGMINILDARRLFLHPRLYGALLLWLLSEFFESLPEVGDEERPRMVLFFDEAHLLFDNASRALTERVEQVVRLIRSKGVGVFFATQNPLDVPDDVASQIGNRFQHGLRAFTPRDQRTVRAVAETFRDNPGFTEETALLELGIGEALVSTLEDKGVPGVVQRTLIRPPTSRIGPLSASERQEVMRQSMVGARYDESIDRDSAFEELARRAERSARAAEAEPERKTSRGGSGRQGYLEAATKSTLRAIGRELGRRLVRGVLGGLKGLG